MTLPKIKWHVELSKELIPHYVIIAEISLGSARYREMHSITQQEIYAFRNGNGIMWKIIEKMRWNMLNALVYYDFDSPVSYDLERMQASVNSGTIVAPSGLSRLERREWVHNNKGKLNDC